MKGMFAALLEIIEKPLRADRGLNTDNSILLIYPPEKELDFREYLVDTFVPLLLARRICHSAMDLTGFPFEDMDADTLDRLSAREFSNPRLMRQVLAQRVERALTARIEEGAKVVTGGTLIIWATVAVYPLVRLGEVMSALRNTEARIVLAFPGEERGGKLHFSNQPDGSNYLAVKLFWR